MKFMKEANEIRENKSSSNEEKQEDFAKIFNTENNLYFSNKFIDPKTEKDLADQFFIDNFLEDLIEYVESLSDELKEQIHKILNQNYKEFFEAMKDTSLEKNFPENKLLELVKFLEKNRDNSLPNNKRNYSTISTKIELTQSAENIKIDEINIAN